MLRPQLYICLGALRYGFVKGYRRVIGVDGCFLKKEHGQLLLILIMVYAFVKVENGNNWKWFLE